MGEIHDLITSVKAREGFKFDGEVAKLIGIDPRELATHKSRDNLPAKLQQWYCDYYNIERKKFKTEIKLTNTDIQLKGASNMDAQYVIDLQRDKIKQQEKEIAMYKDHITRQPLQKLRFDDIQADMSSSVYLRNVFSFKPMERMMNNFIGLENIENHLGLPEDHGFFAENKWFEFYSHPVDKIMTSNTKKELYKIAETLPSLFESLKFVVGNHYMSFPVIYEYEENRCKTMCSILLDWTSSPKRVLTKSIILNGEKD